MKKIALLGSTGSIGTQVLSVVSRYPEKFSVISLAAGKNADLFLRQVQTFRPAVACLKDAAAFSKIKDVLPKSVTYCVGEDAVLSAIIEEADLVFVAVTGFDGLKCVLKAIELKKPIALANKESLCCGGELVMRRAKDAGVPIIPVDSEHSAIWQCLSFDRAKKAERLVLTASGGPFWQKPQEEFPNITLQDALRHPTWRMGAKITVDSATLANKGQEIMEACHLFSLPQDKVEVVIHPQSVVHSMASFADGVTMMQTSYPTMEIPIQLALTYPERLPSGTQQVDFAALGALTFFPVPEEKFPCFTMARQAIAAGGTRPLVYTVANETAVNAFLAEKIAFTEIADHIRRALDKIPERAAKEYAALAELREEVIRFTCAAIEKAGRA